MQLRDRIKEFRRIDPTLIRPNPRNWRVHPDRQREVLRGVLAEIGIVSATLVRELDDGTYMLVDGHLRTEEITGQPIPALVLDITADEETEILATFDPIGDLAEADQEALDELVRGFVSASPAVQELCSSLAAVDPEADQQSLEDLEKLYGSEPDATLFWRDIAVKVPQTLFDRFEAIMVSAPGATEAAKFEALLGAVDLDVLVSAQAA